MTRLQTDPKFDPNKYLHAIIIANKLATDKADFIELAKTSDDLNLVEAGPSDFR